METTIRRFRRSFNFASVLPRLELLPLFLIFTPTKKSLWSPLFNCWFLASVWPHSSNLLTVQNIIPPQLFLTTAILTWIFCFLKKKAFYLLASFLKIIKVQSHLDAKSQIYSKFRFDASDERGPSGPSRSSSVVQCGNFSFSNQLITIYILTFGDIQRHLWCHMTT